ncbi:MAG: PQQ-dependent sugar dehydrogenase [Sphingobacteriales bacterium]|nr:MAG: PQQ-dependent sugar dehydrogenase [Sphingobacteriales bacterium]
MNRVIPLFLSILVFTVFSNVLTSSVKAQTSTLTLDSTVLEITTVATGLHVPWEILWGPDDWLWVTERNGRINRIDPETGTKQLLVTISDCYEYSESGLLGMALHPEFTDNPYVYVAYNYNSGGNKVKLVRYTYNGTVLTDPTILLTGINASSGGNHSGSRLLMLPDQTLLMTTGDYYNDAVAQNLSSLNGKILRINLDGSVPADNPISGSYVYSWGHRNAQGLVRSPSGIIYSSEHGPSNDDEFNIIEPNRNYGWPNVEGLCNTSSEISFCTTNNVREPLVVWTPTLAVAGIDFYNHPAIPEWVGCVLMTNLKAPTFKQLIFDQSGTAIIQQKDIINYTYGRLRDICVAPDGRVFIGTSNQDGRAAGWAGFPQADDDKILQLRNPSWMPTIPQPDFSFVDSCLQVQFTNLSLDATSFQWSFGNGYGSNENNPIHTYLQNGTYNVQLIASNQYTSDTISYEVTVAQCVLPGISNPANNSAVQVLPNPVTGKSLIQFPSKFAGGTLEIIDINGKTLKTITLPPSDKYTLEKGNMNAGVYYLRISRNKETITQKIVIQ